MSLSNKIMEYAKTRRNEFINGGEYERLAMNLGFKASNCSRRMRELENDGRLEKRINKRTVEYRYIPLMEIPLPKTTPKLF